MAIIICPDCGKEQDNLNKFCRNCGADLSKVKIDLGIDEDSTDPVVEGEFSQKSIDVPIQNENGNNSNELVVLESDENIPDAEISSDSIESGTESVQEESIESNVNKCSNCGTELNYGEKFCPTIRILPMGSSLTGPLGLSVKNGFPSLQTTAGMATISIPYMKMIWHPLSQRRSWMHLN